jgi:hypothetical protein
MAWAPVQSTVQRVASGANAKAFASNVTAGSGLIIAIGLETDTATISSVISSTSDTCTAIGTRQTQAGNGASQLYYVKNATAGATTITVTPSTGGSELAIHEYSALHTTAPFDVTAAAQGTGTAADSGNATTAGANELVFGFTIANRAITAGAGFTERVNHSFNIFIQTEDKNGDGGTENAIATIGGSPTQQWITIVAAFKEAAGGGLAPSRFRTLLFVG